MMEGKYANNMQSHIVILRALSVLAMWGGWFGAIALGIWSVFEYDPNHGHFAPQWVGLGFIFLIGLAVAGTASAARYKMARTIIDAFKAGLETSRSHNRDDMEASHQMHKHEGRDDNGS